MKLTPIITRDRRDRTLSFFSSYEINKKAIFYFFKVTNWKVNKKKHFESLIMHVLIGVIASLLFVGTILATGLGTNAASPREHYTPDCCTGPVEGCNPCAGGTSTTTTVPLTTTLAMTTTATPTPTTAAPTPKSR